MRYGFLCVSPRATRNHNQPTNTMTPSEISAAAAALGRLKKGVKEKPSKKKARSNARNGRKGGRPKKVKTEDKP